jgi:ribosome-binding protein aMBF1 (putative translation factor)
MDCQDWTPVTVSSKAAYRPKRVVEETTVTAAKPKKDDIAKPPKTLSSESRQEIVNKRAAAGQTQTQLNVLCNFPVNTIRDIEAGRYSPTPAQLNVLNRVLKTGLKYAH